MGRSPQRLSHSKRIPNDAYLNAVLIAHDSIKTQIRSLIVKSNSVLAASTRINT